jgi:hypothetical protein
MERPDPGTWEGADRREKAGLELILNAIDGFFGRSSDRPHCCQRSKACAQNSLTDLTQSIGQLFWSSLETFCCFSIAFRPTISGRALVGSIANTLDGGLVRRFWHN